MKRILLQRGVHSHAGQLPPSPTRTWVEFPLSNPNSTPILFSGYCSAEFFDHTRPGRAHIHRPGAETEGQANHHGDRHAGQLPHAQRDDRRTLGSCGIGARPKSSDNDYVAKTGTLRPVSLRATDFPRAPAREKAPVEEKKNRSSLERRSCHPQADV